MAGNSPLARLAAMKALPLCTFAPSKNIVSGEEKFRQWLNSWTIIRTLWGGNRTGKTETGGFLFVCLLLGESLGKYLPYMTPEGQEVANRCIELGSRNGWAASVSYGLQPEGSQQKIMRYLPEAEIKQISYLRKSENIISKINLKNGKVCTFKSYEAGRQDFQAAGVGVVWCDEEPPKDIWQEIGLRQEAGLTLYRILTMTPVNGMTWAYFDLYLSPSTNITQSTVGWDDNQHLTAEQKEQMSEGLSDEELEMLRQGRFVKRQGLVYKILDPQIHAVPGDWEPDPLRHKIYRSMDFGFAMDHPFVNLWWAIDTDGSAVIYDELFLRESPMEDTTRKVLEQTQPYHVRGSWGDSARPDWIDYMTRHGLPVQLALKDVELGISKVTEWLTPHSLTGIPRLRISKRCTGLWEQLEQYAYPKKGQDTDRGKKLPEKKDDDGPDALRYFIASFTDSRRNSAGEDARVYGQGDSVTGYGARLGGAINVTGVRSGYVSKKDMPYRLAKDPYMD